MSNRSLVVMALGVLAAVGAALALHPASRARTPALRRADAAATGSGPAGARNRGPVARNRGQAIAVADEMLDRLVLPAGAARMTAVPKGVGGNFLDGPFQRYLIASQVDRWRAWTVAGSPQSVLAGVAAHLPAGTRSLGFTSGASFAQRTYGFRTARPRALGARQLSLAAVATSADTVVLRADAEVRYTAPRPAGERIPAAARVLTVTVARNPSRPLLALTVTRRAQVRRIARIVDGLPFVGNESGLAFNCPALPANPPVDRFVFRRSARGPALASVTAAASTPTEDYPCYSTTLVIDGRHEPDLQDGGILIREAGRLLHVRLRR